MNEKESKEIFDKWFDLHQALIFKVVRVYANTAMDRDDLFQEIIIQLWHSIPSFRKESSVITWIYRIALNTAIKWIRKEKKHARSEALEHLQDTLPDALVKTDERITWLYEEIYKLDVIDRSVTLLLLDNFSYKEMASILGITESNVGVKINRIKKYLIAKTKKYDHHGI